MKVSTTLARTQLPELVAAAERGEKAELTTYGRTVAYLISTEKWEAYQRWLMSED